MRRRLEDWERAEALVTPYSRVQVDQFSPRSKAILEIQSQRDLEILEKIYANSVLLGDDGPDGWGIKYAREFDMTNDSKLFPPRPKWEEKGYRPDALGIWKASDGSVSLPVYVGKMVGNFDFSQHKWVSGKGRGAKWVETVWSQKEFGPDYLMGLSDYRSVVSCRRFKIGFMDITTAVHQRTMMAAYLPDFPCSHLVPTLFREDNHLPSTLWLVAISNSFPFDYCSKRKMGYLHLTKNVIDECPLPNIGDPIAETFMFSARLSLAHKVFSPDWIIIASIHPNLLNFTLGKLMATTPYERIRIRSILDAAILKIYCLSWDDSLHLLKGCDYPSGFSIERDRLGFWRVDKDKDPELRHTVLTLVAFHDLEEKIRTCGGDREKGIEAFLNQNDGKGWMLPETLRLADYGLGHDDRAKEHQPVADRLGPRFYDWQLAQSPEESWRECHLHARNLLGKAGYLNLLAEVLRDAAPGGWREALAFACELSTKDNLLIVFTTAIGQLPPDEWQDRLDEVRGIVSERGFSLDAADMTEILVKALRRAPKKVRSEGLSVARGLVGDAGYRQLLADLEAEDHGKIAEPVEPYGASIGKMTQRRLFD
jgi:hypothetical protein